MVYASEKNCFLTCFMKMLYKKKGFCSKYSNTLASMDDMLLNLLHYLSLLRIFLLTCSHHPFTMIFKCILNLCLVSVGVFPSSTLAWVSLVLSVLFFSEKFTYEEIHRWFVLTSANTCVPQALLKIDTNYFQHSRKSLLVSFKNNHSSDVFPAIDYFLFLYPS